MFGGRVIREPEHRCPVPKVGRLISHAPGTVWQCNCGRQWEVIIEDNRRCWTPREVPVPSRRDVLDALAERMAADHHGDELTDWRVRTHAVLVALEDMGLAGWAQPARHRSTP